MLPTSQRKVRNYTGVCDFCGGCVCSVCLSAYIETGRFPAPYLIYDYKNNPTKVYEQIISQQGGLLNGYSRYSNDVEYGEKPIFKGGTEDCYAALSRRHNEDIQARGKNLRGSRGLSSDPHSLRFQNRDYLFAVERGDTKTAQRMVDEAAEKAFSNSVVRGKDHRTHRRKTLTGWLLTFLTSWNFTNKG